MPFIGNQPALSYTSFAKQDFTTSATTSYTLDNPVANANELALFINFVRQEPTTAYSASGTTLTLTEATSSSDDMYCVYLGKAVQTVTPASGSVTNAMLSSGTFSNITGTGTLTNFSSTGIDDNADATAITIDSSERVGIGTTSPSTMLHLSTNNTGIVSNNTLLFEDTDTSVETNQHSGRIQWKTNDADNGAGIVSAITSYSEGTGATYSLGFSTGNVNTFTQNMTLNGSGQVMIGTTSPIHSNADLSVKMAASSGTVMATERVQTGTARQISFYNPNGEVGYVSTNGTSTAYNTSSDYRLKENIADITDATDRVKQLQPKRFNFITDANTTVDGFVAHEVSSVVPEAITGEKDAVDENGNPEYQGIDQSKLVPVLTKALQEAITKIEELETRIQTLENN